MIQFCLAVLDGLSDVLKRDIEKASNKVVKLNAQVSDAAKKLEARVDYYNDLIKEAQGQHAELLNDNAKAVQKLIIRRNAASRLKAAITNLTNGDTV